MINLIVNLMNEIKSYFVPEKMEYEVVGACKKCGKCCNYMYSFDTYTEQEFKFMQVLFPSYKRFYIKGKDEDGNFIFACKYVSKEGLCTVYNKRLKMCKIYPNKKILYPAKLHEGCGYRVIEKDFEDYLKTHPKRKV
ncbi:MAG: YkgJ family cysteine cluster protein, partial [bacterium]